ncbi:hypothetical protein [Vagococcus intermedius]|uniref:Uncharacterized protein n=1 Tax=Vagococcus intermedius TaxID=2991418 RepID=A0AAF0CU89_9ENTE|nr:hypothetical protein [Vagococcus intermedius]WEG73098.1 hypothetical protein OL234_09030 [Vagococcus intermedius]WEG75182.1 hypothetical protein OL235_09025 [Vagococcus intermedius]
MKKTNFIVIFWLVLALIFTIVLLFNLSTIFESISYMIIPTTSSDSYMSSDDVKRSLISSVPMALIALIGMFTSIRAGLKVYKNLTVG